MHMYTYFPRKKLEANENVPVGGRCNWEERIATGSKISNTSLYSFDFEHVNILHFQYIL